MRCKRVLGPCPLSSVSPRYVRTYVSSLCSLSLPVSSLHSCTTNQLCPSLDLTLTLPRTNAYLLAHIALYPLHLPSHSPPIPLSTHPSGPRRAGGSFNNYGHTYSPYHTQANYGQMYGYSSPQGYAMATAAPGDHVTWSQQPNYVYS